MAPLKNARWYHECQMVSYRNARWYHRQCRNARWYHIGMPDGIGNCQMASYRNARWYIGMPNGSAYM